MKKIYIVMTQTGTLLSRVIKIYSGCKYAHVSLSLDKNLDEMYSFGRLNPYNPFWGGFIHERVNSGTFKRFKKMEERINPYRFNILGLIGAGFNISVHMKDHFYCAEFIKYLLEAGGVKVSLPKIVAPDDFMTIPNTKMIYMGKLSKYRESLTEVYDINLEKEEKRNIG